MDNQQARTLYERTRLLGRNAVLGDGSLWKHPEVKNYKVIYTSTTPELLEVKYSIAPEIFTTGVKPATVGAGGGRYANAKPMFRLASTTNTMFTELKCIPKEELYAELTISDFGLWYLDDGCTIQRTDNKAKSNRYYLCIGDCCNTPERLHSFEECLVRVFGNKPGAIRPNNSKATENNKTWLIPVGIAELIMQEASKYRVLQYKFPTIQFPASETIETGVSHGVE